MAFKIMNEGNACFQHLKSVTKIIIEFHSYLANKPNLVSRQVFCFIKKKLWPLPFICYLGFLCALSGCNAIVVTVQRFFGEFYTF